MKWTRGKDHIQEYSNGYIGVRHYISMTHKNGDDNYHYTYTNNSLICFGDIPAGNWDEAEQIAIKRIKEELSWRTNYWKRLLNDFNAEVNANETLD